MAWIVADSFDYYANPSDTAHSVWDVMVNTPTIQGAGNTRFGVGQCFQLYNANGDYLIKNMLTNESTIYFVAAYYAENAITGSSPCLTFRLRDAGTNQCSVTFDSDGAIRLRSGSGTGTVLATYPNALPQTLWVHYQIRVVIDTTVGSFTLRKNGALSDTFSATGLNTRGGTTNSYCNSIVIGGSSFSNYGVRMDDFLCYSGTAPAPNNWVGDVRAVCQLPVVDTTQKNFAANLSAQTTTTVGGPTGTATVAANTMIFAQMNMGPKGGQIVKATIQLSAGVTGHIQAAFYRNDGNLHTVGGGPWASGGLGNYSEPKTLLATSAVVTNPAAGAVDFTFTNFGLSPNDQVYLAFLSDVAFSTTTAGWMFGTNGYWVISPAPYGSGFPALAPGPLANVPSTNYPGVTVAWAGNCISMSESLPNGDTDYVASSNVGDEDLYTVQPLSFTPYAILGVVSRVYIKKSDAGTRQGQLRVKSGATEVFGVDTAVSTTYSYLWRVDAVDPNTGAAWTLAAVNALQVGQKVTL